MAKLVSKTYGDALFELAIEKDTLDALLTEVETVLDILKENEEFVSLMCHPEIDQEEKSKILKTVFDGRVSEDLMGLLMTVEEKGRFKEIEDVFAYFIARAQEHKGIGTAHVASAVALNESEKKALEDKLLETTSYHSFVMDYQVDPSLIGGMRIRIGDRVVDSSIRTKLDSMANTLSAIQLGTAGE